MEQITYFLDRFAESPITNIIDIALVATIIFGLFFMMRGTRAVQLFRGIIVLVLLLVVISISVINLTGFRWLVTVTLPALIVSVPIIFQPELRRALEQLGRTDRYFRIFRRNQESDLVLIIANAVLRLSQRRYGALIVIEQDTGLQDFIETGVTLDAKLSPDLLLTIFNKHTELHDGAVIVHNDRLAAAACVLPLSTRSLSDRQMGLRHRAAMGISEVSDAVVIVVSEETGQVSIAHNGRILRRQDPSRLDVILTAFLQGQSSPVTVQSGNVTSTQSSGS
ncbi:MAG: diadenylate cyclase CdaA [Anaerolineae bacterium]|nr:MAG: diadenylate cyclase CdaA [Anaerolineae bacterium]